LENDKEEDLMKSSSPLSECLSFQFDSWIIFELLPNNLIESQIHLLYIPAINGIWMNKLTKSWKQNEFSPSPISISMSSKNV
jgi:hypothetical protein